MSKLPRFIVVFVIPLVILAAGAVGAVNLVKSREKPPRKANVDTGVLVATMPVSRTTETISVDARGTVRPAQRLVVHPRVPGEVIWVNEKLVPGGIIEQGEPLFRIEARDFKIAIQERSSGVAQAEAQLNIEEGQQRVARKEWELFKGQIDQEQADPSLALRAPQRQMAEVSLDAAKSRLEKAKLDLSRTTVRAPFNLMVESESIEKGQLVNQQSPVATVIGTDAFWVQVSVPIDRLQLIEIPEINSTKGSAVTVLQDVAGIEVSRPGRVVRLLGDLDPIGRMARVLVEVDDPFNLKAAEEGGVRGLPFLVGSYVNVAFEGSREVEVMIVPRTALHDGESVHVFDDGKLDVREVKIVWSREDAVLVGSGIEPGDEVVTTRIPTPVNGMKLRKSSEGGTEVAQQGAK